MKGKIISCSIKMINPGKLQLPNLIYLDTENITEICKQKEIKLDLKYIWLDRWACEDLQMIIPDFAADKNKIGYYLEQTEDMRRIRDQTFQCSLCNMQFVLPDFRFCPYCLQSHDLNEDLIYLMYLRPVSTLDIKLSKKSIKIPDYILGNTMPELLPSGKMIRL